MLLFAGSITTREINRGVKMRHQIQAMNATLEARVEQRTAELTSSEERLQLFIDHAPAALAMFDREMRYLHVSRRWLDDYGLLDQDLSGVSHTISFPRGRSAGRRRTGTALPARWCARTTIASISATAPCSG
jgi:PAS domain-containing protein